MSAPADDEGWLSPTRAWRVAQCPASAGPGVGPVIQTGKAPQNKGSLAHRAVELWVRAGGYRSSDIRGAMRVAIEKAVGEVAADVPPDWTLTSKRLLARAPGLTESIGDDFDAVVPEHTFRDDALRVYGTPDIVVLGSEIRLIDLKTEQLDENELSPWIAFQLSIYAYLVGQEHGRLPDRVEVFSTHRGRIPVAITQSNVESAIAALQAARRADSSEANPSEETCRYCRRRLRCGAQWEAAASWPSRDCIAGRVSRSERSANGLTGLWLETADGPALLSRVPSVLVPDIDGASIRAVRVSGPPSTDGEQIIWRWGARSALAVGPT